jgi:type I restriction enzyme S subunit
MVAANILPDGWKWTTLGSQFSWGSGGTPLKSRPEYYNGDIPWVIIGDLNDGLITETQSRISNKGLQDSSAKWVEEGSILVAMYGSIGKLGIAGMRLTTNQAIAFTKPESVLGKYLFYYLMGERNNLLNLGAGATQQNISQTIIKAYPFPLAPLPEQESIVAKIEELFTQLDAGVAALKRIQAGLKRYKASVLKAACEGRLVPQDPNDEPAEELMRRLGKEPLAGEDLPSLPEGWCWAKLASLVIKIADVDHKMPKPADTNIPYVSTRDFTGYDEINLDGAKKISQHDFDFLCRKVKPEFNDILLSRYGTVGEVRKVKTHQEFQASYSIAIIKTLKEVDLTDYLLLAFRSDVLQAQIKRDVRATAQPDLGLAHIREFIMSIPPINEQHRILAEVERRLSVVQELESSLAGGLARASRLRQSILKRAFEGRLVEPEAG